MAKMLSALILAVALMFGLGTASSYACGEQTAEAEDATGSIQLAADDTEDDDGEDGDDDADE